MTLFQYGVFRLHSGDQSWFKINCDGLSDEDLETLALLIYEDVGSFGYVEGVPTGGERLAETLKQYVNRNSTRLLIVDDVLTTGASMEEHRADRTACGYVIFARGKCPFWVKAIFTMEPD